MAIPATSPDFKYRAFISYSHQDQVWGQWLHKALETYRVPSRLVGTITAAGVIPRRLTPIFRDRDELPSAHDLNRKVNEALAQSANLIVICSPSAARSPWVDAEVLAFKRLGRADRVFCVIVGGEPDASDRSGHEAEECFAEALRYTVDADGRLTKERTEPIAADARSGKDGKGNAKLKLIAGMLDVGFDALKQREQQRRVRRWALLAAGSFAGMLLTGALSVYALHARHEAIAQRSQAEGLIEFMLGDLRKTLEPIGRLDALDAVGKRALAYYAAEKPHGLDADELGRRARALHMIGEVDDLRGHLDDALAVFHEAAASTSELLERAPNDGQRIFDQAQSVYWVGYVAFQRGQNAEAEQAFNKYRVLAERLVAIDPAKPAWQAEVGYAYSNLGTLLLKEGRFAEAASAFEHSLKVSTALARAAPHDSGLQLEKAQSLAWLADALEGQGRFDSATGWREAELAIYQNVLKTDPGNNDARRGSLVARETLAALALAKGRLSQTIDQLKIATKFADDLIAAEPKNTDWGEMEGFTYADLGEALFYDGADSAAQIEIARATTIAETLVKRDPSVIRWSIYLLSRCQSLEAKLRDRSGDHAGALSILQDIVQRIEALPPADQTDQIVRWKLAGALLASGDQYQALGRATDARKAWQRVVTLLRPDQQREDAPMQTVLATALLRLGSRDDAQLILAHLRAIGYRHPDFVALEQAFASDTQDRRTAKATAASVPPTVSINYSAEHPHP